ncbi:MAG: hydrogenase maturation nickel metallochaperone HypA [Methanobacteriota archaeon]|nr:MAG: hydrogenase maturation nickel metallochaperone HypA [Euryarchaeota archaeon]
MHEISVMSEIVKGIIDEAQKRNALRVERVSVEIGEYTMLGEEQLRFAFKVISKDTLLENAELDLRTVAGTIECECGFKGEASPASDTPHRSVPVLECPKCGGGARTVGGRECVIRDIRMVVPDV